ncbi:MAG TPA: archaellin/type IV pilin N-terminal domain-containing protein [Candidatus Thermoplasmatota archaeon]|nr:archaellin/type IV pilin N-terminal domain-containing protein [Candidatus Thermoplasmatota archaeon]
MKSNRRFRLNRDDAVSPVIAVILMVAITVVLAATVYVWVSGFGASGSQAKNLSLSQGTASNLGAASGSVAYTIVSVSPNFACSAFKATSTGTGGPWTTSASAAGASEFRWSVNGAACSGNIAAGDTLRLLWGSGTTGPAAGDTINFIDTASGNVVASLVLHS